MSHFPNLCKTVFVYGLTQYTNEFCECVCGNHICIHNFNVVGVPVLKLILQLTCACMQIIFKGSVHQNQEKKKKPFFHSTPCSPNGMILSFITIFSATFPHHDDLTEFGCQAPQIKQSTVQGHPYKKKYLYSFCPLSSCVAGRQSCLQRSGQQFSG